MALALCILLASCDLGSPNLKFICRTGFAGRADARDYPLANKFDEVDTLVDALELCRELFG